jgi:hypothetical protein
VLENKKPGFAITKEDHAAINKNEIMIRLNFIEIST